MEWENERGVSEEADNDGWDAVENVGGEPNAGPESVASKLGDIDAAHQADGYSDCSSDGDELDGPEDRILQPSAEHSRGPRELGEEVEAQPANTLDRHVREDGTEHDAGKRSRAAQNHLHPDIDDSAPTSQ